MEYLYSTFLNTLEGDVVMSKSKKTPEPLLTPVTQIVKTIVQEEQTPEVEAQDESVKNLVMHSIENYATNLVNGRVKVTSVNDFEKLVKLYLLLNGRPDCRVGSAIGESEVTTIEDNLLDLDVNDEDVINLYNKMFANMNEKNDE